MKNIYFILILILLSDYCYSQLSCPGIPTVSYGGQTYNTVQIGNQCWLKENLNIGIRINGLQQQTNNGTIEKYCYNNDLANCTMYGGLYQWAEAVQYNNGATNTSYTNSFVNNIVQGICPAGWHIPDKNEFNTLISIVHNDGNSLKAIGQGLGIGRGTNTSGFSAMLNGVRFSDGSFDLLGFYNFFVSSTEWDAMNVYYFDLGIDSALIYLGNNSKTYGRSVRCINDNLVSAINSDISTPDKFNLEQNYPNPWNPSTTIRYQLPIGSKVTIKVYNALGIEIAVLVNEEKSSGSYAVKLNGRELSSGVYYYQIKAGNFVMTKKLTLIK
jgi:uncharacterized protein (TIGR02145 family)